jgi:ribonuclease HI
MANAEKGYIGRNIDILSDSGAAIKALESFQINSSLIWDYHQSLVKLAENNRIQLIWLPRHTGSNGNDIAVATRGSSLPLIGPQPALGIG